MTEQRIRHLLGIEDISRETAQRLLDLAQSFLEVSRRPVRKVPALRGKTVLEAGSGAGRFTEILLKYGAVVHSFDYSDAVEANAQNNGASDRLLLVQGDIRRIPFARSAYDYVICLGVLQHTPSPEASLESLWTMVKPGGRLVIDHYRWRLRFVLPTPFGSAESAYRLVTLRLPEQARGRFVEVVTRFWFPIHWKFRNSRFAQRLIRRFSPSISIIPILRWPGRLNFWSGRFWTRMSPIGKIGGRRRWLSGFRPCL